MNFTYVDFCAFVNLHVDLGHKYYKPGRQVHEDVRHLKRDFEEGDPGAKRFVEELVAFRVLHRLVGGSLPK